MPVVGRLLLSLVGLLGLIGAGVSCCFVCGCGLERRLLAQRGSKLLLCLRGMGLSGGVLFCAVGVRLDFWSFSLVVACSVCGPGTQLSSSFAVPQSCLFCGHSYLVSASLCRRLSVGVAAAESFCLCFDSPGVVLFVFRRVVSFVCRLGKEVVWFGLVWIGSQFSCHQGVSTRRGRFVCV